MTTNPSYILQSLNGMFRNKKLYPPGHPALFALTKKTFNLLNAYMASKDSAFFGVINDTFVFDDFPILDAPTSYFEVFKNITEKEIEAVSFKKGFTEQEVADCMDVLADERALSSDDLLRLFRSKGIRHITLKVHKTEERNSIEIYEGALSAVKSIMGEIRMGKIPDSSEIKEIVSDMADSILEDPNAMLGLTMIKEYDDYLYTHCINVGLISLAIGRSLGLNENDLHSVGLGGLLHDIGKIAVSEEIIRKPGGLDSEEWNQLKEHPVMGSDIAKRMEGLDDIVMRMIYEHHIRYDHSGYPVSEATLHPLTPIATIADAYDALTTLRVYQKPQSPLNAVKILQKLSGKHFEPKTLNAFIKILGAYPVGTTVSLSTGEIGVVTRAIHESDDDQKVKIILDNEGKKYAHPKEITLAKEGEDGARIIEPVEIEYDLSGFFENEARDSDSAA